MTVPAAIAVRAKMHPGTRLDWEPATQEGMIIVRVLPDPAELASGLRGRGRKDRRRGTAAVGNLIRERAREDRQRG